MPENGDVKLYLTDARKELLNYHCPLEFYIKNSSVTVSRASLECIRPLIGAEYQNTTACHLLEGLAMPCVQSDFDSASHQCCYQEY